MADGLTIQRSSRIALEQGTTLGWTLESIAAHRPEHSAPILLMSYLNPLLSFGRLAWLRKRVGRHIRLHRS